MLFADLSSYCKLLLRFQLRAAGTDDIKTSGIAVLIDVSIIKNDVVIFQQSAGAALKPIEDILFVGRFQRVIQTAHYIVSARSLTAGQDHADHLFFRCRSVASLLECDLFLTISIREKRLNLFLICRTGGLGAFLHADL